MSDVADEPEKDRAYLSLTVVALAFVFALCSWNSGSAAPSSGGKLPKATGGVVTKGDNTLVRGVVLQRGSAVHVLTNSGAEVVIPRSEIAMTGIGRNRRPLMHSEDERWLQEGLKSRLPASAKPTTVGQRGVGTVIDREGQVLIGRLHVRAGEIEITKDDGESLTYARQNVRWFKLGVRGPSADYFSLFPDAKLDPRYAAKRPQPKADTPEARERKLARNHRLSGRLEAATLAWAKICLRSADREALRELDSAFSGWSKRQRFQACQSLEQAIGAEGFKAQPAVRKLYARNLVAMAEAAQKAGDKRAFRDSTERLIRLGGEHAEQGKLLQLNNR